MKIFSDRIRILQDKKGSLFLLTLLLVVVILILGAALAVVSVVESRTAERERLTIQAFHVAEAGLERGIYELRQDFLADLSSPSWADGDINGIDVTGSYVSGSPPAGYYPLLSGSLNGGTFSVEIQNESGSSQDIWIKSTGILGGSSQVIRVYARINNISPWGNAIFAGTGSATTHRMINGNVDVRGSVHILGTGLTSSDAAVELGGTAELIGNNYKGMDASLLAKVPALPTTVVGGETVETLSAELRVKNGQIILDGASSCGNANQTGNAYKEMIDASFVTDGFGGSGAESNVHSDNGWSNPYDLGDTVSFPSLTDPYMGYATYQAWLKANALVIDAPADLATLASLDSSTSFSAIDISSGKGSITFDGSGNLTVDGIVYIDGGDFIIRDKNNTVSYTGTGSLFATGNVEINTNLVTAGNNSFPNNVIGFMTPGDIVIGTEAQLEVMGLFYAENQITTSKQTELVGSLVSNYFDIGSQVPEIYQVPETINYLPPGLIGQSASWSMRIMAWQKL